MATMIPPAYLDATSSNAEKKIFALFQRDTATSDWTVFHSLNLSVDSGRRYGELDFVLLIPSIGIICLEVKGGGISCDSGIWFSTGADGVAHELKRSPFAQARANMFSLRERLEKQFGKHHEVCSLPMGFIAVFPDCKCLPESPEFTRGEVIDCDDLLKPISASIMRFARSKLNYPTAGKNFKHGVVFRELRAFLRPDFDRGISRSATISNSEERIIEFTAEQLGYLEGLEDNPRCLIEGAAGTGKTLLALHYSKERAGAGKRVLLICFNKMLGRWIGTQIGDTPRLRAGAFLSTLRKMILLTEFEQEYLQKEENVPSKELPELVCEYGRLAILQFEEKFDVLVVDEIQDLAGMNVLTVFDEWLVNGLGGGEWALFGDFTRQSLFNADQRGRENLKKFCPSPASFKLTKNCRNTKQIAEAATTLSGFDTYPYKQSIAEGAPVDFSFWKTTDEQYEQIDQSVSKFLAEGIAPQDIVIMSPFKFENSGLKDHQKIAGIAIQDLSESASNTVESSIGFTTIHAFKGMESSVVMLVDLDSLSDGQRALLYVGMSRARSALHVFASQNCKTQITELLSKKTTVRK